MRRPAEMFVCDVCGSAYAGVDIPEDKLPKEWSASSDGEIICPPCTLEWVAKVAMFSMRHGAADLSEKEENGAVVDLKKRMIEDLLDK